MGFDVDFCGTVAAAIFDDSTKVRFVPLTTKAHCQETNCGHSASGNVGGLPDDFPVPDVALRLRCSTCGSPNVKTRPDWTQSEGHGSHGP